MRRASPARAHPVAHGERPEREDRLVGVVREGLLPREGERREVELGALRPRRRLLPHDGGGEPAVAEDLHAAEDAERRVDAGDERRGAGRRRRPCGAADKE